MAVDELLCVTVVAEPGEAESAFRARLTQFWTHVLRNFPTEYESVFAESAGFGTEDGCVSRQYMVGTAGLATVLRELSSHKIQHLPVDEDEVYTRYEATGSEWFQIPH